MDNEAAFPSKAEVLEDLSSLSDTVGRILAKAIQKARTWFEKDGLPFEPTLFACMVRYHAKIYMAAEALDAEDDAEALLSETLPNIGLQIFHKGYLVKILKASDGLPPVPNSASRVGFYNQQLQMFFNSRTRDVLETRLNLLYLWDCNEQHHQDSLKLCCPSSGGRSRAEVVELWSESLNMAAEPVVTATAEDTADLPFDRSAWRDDLEIGETDVGSGSGKN